MSPTETVITSPTVCEVILNLSSSLSPESLAISLPSHSYAISVVPGASGVGSSRAATASKAVPCASIITLPSSSAAAAVIAPTI